MFKLQFSVITIIRRLFKYNLYRYERKTFLNLKIVVSHKRSYKVVVGTQKGLNPVLIKHGALDVLFCSPYVNTITCIQALPELQYSITIKCLFFAFCFLLYLVLK